MRCTSAKHHPRLAESSVKMGSSAKVCKAERGAHRVYVQPPFPSPFLHPNLACLEVFDSSLSQS